MLFRRSTLKAQGFINHYRKQAQQLRYLYTFHPNSQTQRLLEETSALKQDIEKNYDAADIDLKAVLHQKLRSLWTYHSNAIEGSTLSLGDTIFFLQEGITVGGKPLKDFMDAKNHAKAIDYMYEVVIQQRPIDSYLLRNINAILLGGVESTPALDPLGRKVDKPLNAGHYKTLPNHVLQPDGTIHRYVEPYQVPSEMSILFDWIEKNLTESHPVITAAVAHYNMVRIHPFDDGNGRGAHILMNLILLREHYTPAIIKIEDRREYITCLTQADKGDINPFIGFVAKSLICSQEAILEELDKYNHQPASMPKLN